jgi:hypothetical protein
MAIKHACCASPAHPLLARRAPRLLPRRRQCLPAGDLARFRRGACILEAAADMPGCGAKQPRRHADRRGAGRLLWYSRHPRPDAATPRSRSRARRRLRRWSWCSAAAAGGRNSGVRGANRELARESASEVSDRRPEKSSAELVRNSCDRRPAGLLPCTSTSTSSLVDGGDTAARLLAPGVNLANGSADRPVGGARVLHPRGRRAAVAPSVGVTPGVPKQSRDAA